MEEIKTTGDYKTFKAELDTELKKSAESFVRIGYLLKVARDTEVLYESGYGSVAEFAQAEYGLTKDIVSRYIAINDRYSENGYSEHLKLQYKDYGVAKLAEMLTLPDAVIESMSPQLTRKEIQEIKREVKEEEQVTDIEVMLEGQSTELEGMSLLQKFIHQYFYEHQEHFLNMAEVLNGSSTNMIEDTLDAIAPSGIAMKTARIQGIGKIMLSIRGKDTDIELVNMRSNEKESIPWEHFIEEIRAMFTCNGTEADWESYYKEPYYKEVAPVQQENETKTEEIETEIKESGTIIQETTTEQKENKQIPGQMNVNDYPELRPDNTTEVNVDEKVENSQSEKPENLESIKCETNSSEKLENVDKIAEIIEPETPENVENIKWDADSKEGFLSMDTADQYKMMTETQNKVLDILQKAQLDITETRIYILAKARLQDAIRELDKLQQWKDWR